MPNLKAEEYKQLKRLSILEKLEVNIRVQGNSLMYLTILSRETFRR
ncbi:Uncharacterised protein [Fusobacterium nucleatum]|nr:Uncharacterised protein [Fusobacterium nucleatum]